MKRKSFISAILLLLTVCYSCVSISTAGSGDPIYRGTDPRVFDDRRITAEGDKEIVSPARAWKWRNSWHVVKKQPGFRGTDSGNGPYTLTRSNNIKTFEDMTWAHFLYFPYQEQLAERYGNNRIIEKKIEEERGHSARVVRIDKLDRNFYVATYIRSPASYKNFYFNRVREYPFFNLPDNVTLGENAIYFNVKVKSFDPYGRAIFSSQQMKMSIGNILLLNPAFLIRPAELEDIFVPYEFFRKGGLAYQHPAIKRSFKNSGDPMVVKVMKKGIIFRFSKQPAIEEL